MSDVPSDAEIDAACKASDALFDEIVDRLEAGEEDPDAVAYGLWRCLTQWLAVSGWTPEELGRDAVVHATVQTTDGSA